MNEQKNHVVKWRVNGTVKQGGLLSESEARAWVDCLNEKYPNLHYWMESS